VDGLQRGSQQELGFFVARRPPAFAIDTLPGDLELLVNQNHSLGASATGTRHTMLVEDVMSRKASLHVRLVGLYKLLQ
jgi:hypothetical protein